MIYFVTASRELFGDERYKTIGTEESLSLLSDCDILQADSETTGTNPHIDHLLSFQLGNDKKDIRVVIDCSTMDIRKYKDLLEHKGLVFHNAKFDLQFLYAKGIVPRMIYDTMIVEQLLYLGYPSGQHSYSLQGVAQHRLGVYIDKTVRGKIIWRGLDPETIVYGAGDVTYLEKIMHSQIEECRKKGCMNGMRLECNAVPFMAYMEWCGIKMDTEKWKAKMKKDKENLQKAEKDLCTWFINSVSKYPKFKDYVYVNTQGDLWEGFDLTPKCKINWASSQQVVNVAKIIGFNTTTQDKKTGEDKDTVLEKQLKTQRGIDDEFLSLYFQFKEYDKVVSSFGQGHLDAINPITGRIHTNYHQLGASSGRMSCGSGTDPSLARYKHLPEKSCKMLNMQQLPANEETRSCFVAEKGNLWVSCDFSAEEARLAGDIYQDKAIIDIFLKGIDSHSMYAKIFFKDELKDINVNEVKKLRPDLRQKAKGPEFALNFGGGARAIMQAINCSEEEANTIIRNYEEGFKGTAEFAKRGSRAVRQNGYVLINPITGHKMYWWDWKHWKEEEKAFKEPGFWDHYREVKKDRSDSELLKRVSTHFKAASKYDRMARNSPCQGTAAIILKDSQIRMFNWVVDNGWFGKVLLVNLTHDEANWECPEELGDIFPDLLRKTMEESAAKYCKSLPIPASEEVHHCWVH